LIHDAKRKTRVPNVDQELDALPSPAASGFLLLVMRVALKRKRLIWMAAAVMVTVALVVALLLPNRYTASIAILPPQQGGSAGATMIAQLGNLGALAGMGSSGLSIKNPNDLQVALLKSRSVEDAMVERFHLQALYHRRYVSSARRKWEQKTSVDNGLKDGVIRMSVTDTDPRRATDLVNGWLEEYRRFSATLAVTEAAQRRLFFEGQLAEAHAALGRAEEEMKQTGQRTGVIELDGQAHAMIASAAMLRAQVAAKRVEIQSMRQFAADGNPDLERVRQELSSLEAQLTAMDVDNERLGGDLVAPKGKLGQAGMEYARALREVKYREMVQDLLTRQYEVARVDEARQGSAAQIIDPAVIPDRPNYLYKIWIVLAALLFCLPAGLLIALAAEVMDLLRSYRRRAGSWAGALEEAWAGGAR
jgi:uncharacterized protein involved in exopolysaccharide biosynthesis